MTFVRTFGLFVAAACAEITGSYLAYIWVKTAGSPWWVLFVSILCLGAFAILLTLQTGAAGRTYAAYGGAYVAISLAWLWLIEHQRPTRWDILGASIIFVGMGVILFGNKS